jgi:hypothetical protein
VDASAANYRSLNRFLRHGGTSPSLAFRAAQLDALATVAPRLAEPLTLWRGFSSSLDAMGDLPSGNGITG